MDNVPIPGVHRNVPFAEYLRWPLLSQSTLKEGRASMAHLRAALEHERVKEVTDDMALGSALDTCFLEPERMPDRVIKWTGGARRGSGWEAFAAEHADKTILTPGLHENLVGMVQSLRRHKVVREWTSRIEDVQVSRVGEVDGVPFKGRCDALTSDPLFDLKKVQSGDPRLFVKSIMSFGYHIQAAIYRQLFERDRFVLLTVEDKPPYDVVAFELSPAFIRLGGQQASRLLERYKACMESGVWPGRSDDIVTLEPPEWADESNTVTLAGEAAFSSDPA